MRLTVVLLVLSTCFACSSTHAVRGGGGVVVLLSSPSPAPGDRLRVGDVHITARGGDRITFFETVVFEDEDGDGLRDPDERAWSEARLNGPLDHDVDVRTGAARVHVTERTRQLVRLELASGFAHVEVWRVTAEGLLPP